MKFLSALLVAVLLVAVSQAQVSAKASASAPAKPMPTAGGPVTYTVQACPAQSAPAFAARPVLGFAVAAPLAVGGKFRDWLKKRHHILPHTTTKSFAVTRQR